MFMRNRKRTSTAWQQLREIDKKTKVVVSISDNDPEIRSPQRKKRHKQSEPEIPRWQRDENFIRMLSEELSDNSDLDTVEVKTVDSNHTPTRPSKQKERSRSRSITPPPAPPILEIQMARNIVRQTLDPHRRAMSPVALDLDDSTDTIILDPELARIAKSVALESTLDGPPRRFQTPTGEQDTVLLSVRWQPYPQDPNGSEDVWVFKMNRDDTFRDLFEATAEEASILTANLVITYNRARIFPSVSPRALNMWTEAELVACEKTTHAYLQSQSRAETESIIIESQQQQQFSRNKPSSSTSQPTSRIIPSGTPAIEIDSDDDSDEPPTQSIISTQPLPASQQTYTQPQAKSQPYTRDSDAESDVDDNKFKIVLQSSLTQGRHITLTVRPTTKCGSIVKAFLKKAGLADQYPQVFADANVDATQKRGRRKTPIQKDPRIYIDGEKMENETEIGEADLEDGDMVEVVGL
ncbi:hypothetical protein AMATHDRAFT_50986 [Amanita thiersii Skay4041]|uniref:Rad60/SUMO-like domain-containing protein n=1 Tax=Amanita thiersii Skay4041 TaxID=703135 RepID=A0A2A9N989_9AGAR|nr:hypothetical protein AMATHDRAFT_50986 [Amanita thiersii Skay4041]